MVNQTAQSIRFLRCIHTVIPNPIHTLYLVFDNLEVKMLKNKDLIKIVDYLLNHLLHIYYHIYS